MARRLAIWLVALVVLIGATGGLLTMATTGATTFRVDGTRLLVSGPLSGASPERFEMLMEQNPQIDTMVLGDIPGASDITAVVQNGYRVRNFGLATELAPGAEVAGDAVWLFLGGADRRAGDGARLVLQDWGGAALADDAPAHEERRRYVEDMLGSDAFYWFTQERLRQPGAADLSETEMTRLGLITGG